MSYSTPLIYALGFLGIASVGLIPFRVLRFLVSIKKISPGVLTFAISTLVCGLIIACDLAITARVFKCLTQNYCGPNVASGWIYLAMLGVAYIIFELVAGAFGKVIVSQRDRRT